MRLEIQQILKEAEVSSKLYEKPVEEIFQSVRGIRGKLVAVIRRKCRVALRAAWNELNRESSAANFTVDSRAIHKAAVKMAAASFLRATLYWEGTTSYNHHWVSETYLNSFNVPKRIVHSKEKVPTIYFDAYGNSLQRFAVERNFIHGMRLDGSGFYDTDLELFFAATEELYGTAKATVSSKELRASAIARYLIFAISLAIRSPAYSASNGTVQTLYEAYELYAKAFDIFSSMEFSINGVGKNLYFSKASVLRIQNSVELGKTYVMPMSRNNVLLISEKVLTKNQKIQIIAATQNGVVARERSMRREIFGMLPEELPEKYI